MSYSDMHHILNHCEKTLSHITALETINAKTLKSDIELDLYNLMIKICQLYKEETGDDL